MKRTWHAGGLRAGSLGPKAESSPVIRPSSVPVTKREFNLFVSQITIISLSIYTSHIQ